MEAHLPAITIPQVPSQIYLHHTTLCPRPKLILLGDSITELGSSHAQGWVTSLAIRYNRRMDVMNRGMNGYTSRWGLAALPLILDEILGPPSPILDGECPVDEVDEPIENSVPASKTTVNEQVSAFPDQESMIAPYPQYVFLIGYGANDSCLPSGGSHARYHVPLDEYTLNLKEMIRLIRTWNMAHFSEKKIAVALLTPPPCDTEKLKHIRDNENMTKLYAEACRRVARDIGVPVVDLWSRMQLPLTLFNAEQPSTFASNQQWKLDYLSDGLHLTPIGNYRLYELVVELLDRPDMGENRSVGMGLAITSLPRSYPDHTMIDTSDPKNSFGTDRMCHSAE